MARRARRWHPELDCGVAPDVAAGLYVSSAPSADVAIDFVDMRAVVDRIHAAFFHTGR